MTDNKVPGGPPSANHPGDAPPPYIGGQQSGAPPNQSTPAMYTQYPSYSTQSNAAFIQQMGPLPGSTFKYHNAPALIVCQHCNATVTTNISYESGLLTWAAAGVVCLFMGWLGCCLIPFCVDSSKDVKHTCPNCGKLVGKFRQLS